MGAAVHALSKWHLRCNAGVDTVYVRYGRTRTEEAARRTRTEGRTRTGGPTGRESRDAGPPRERREGAGVYVAKLKSKHSSGGSIVVEVGCVPEGLARCTQDCSPGTVSKNA